MSERFERRLEGANRLGLVESLDELLERWAAGDPVSAVLRDSGPTPEEALLREELVERVRAAVESLGPRLSWIVTRRRGLDGVAPATLREVAEGLGMSHENVRLLERKAHRRLREILGAGFKADPGFSRAPRSSGGDWSSGVGGRSQGHTGAIRGCDG